MNFNEHPNPKAASEVIKDFQKRFSEEVCLSPTRDCSGQIVAAHTLSVGSMLKPISRDGKVYALKQDHYKRRNGRSYYIALRSLKETSVFNGFCAKHDKEIFSPIEDRGFVCSKEQLFLHAYRAVAKEAYLKRRQADFVVPPDKIKELHGIPDSFKVEMTKEYLMHVEISKQAAREVELLKLRMDRLLIDQDFTRIQTTVVPFESTPVIASNFIYAPDFDFEENYLQDFHDLKHDLSVLMVTCLPMASGGGYLLMSHEDTANRAPRRFINSICAQEDLTSCVLWFLLSQAENFAISPVWYDAQTPAFRIKLMNIFAESVSSKHGYSDQLSKRDIAIESWKPGRPFQY